MIATAEHIISMLLSIIVSSVDSLDTLNLLVRTSRSLRIAAGDSRLIYHVIGNMPAASKQVVCKLFVLPEKVSLPFIILPSLYNTARLSPRFSVLEAFRVAMVTHEGMKGMVLAFHRRHRRSLSMKLVWKKKKEEIHQKWQARRRDIDQIHQDLLMIPSSDHVKTEAEVYYLSSGKVARISAVYRDQRNNTQTPPSKTNQFTEIS
jgi:hypothetical protein